MSIENQGPEKIIRKEPKPPHPDQTDEETFDWYQKTLKLTPEDLDKKILDVGSGSAQFAKYVREHTKNAQIFSMDPYEREFSDKQNIVKGKVGSLPFKSEEFELVISVASIPNVLHGKLNEDGVNKKTRIKNAMKELLRVTKPGGEIRLGPVVRKSFRLSAERPGFHEDFVNTVSEIFAELEQSDGIKIQETYIKDTPYYDHSGKVKVGKSGEQYLVVISKPNK